MKRKYTIIALFFLVPILTISQDLKNNSVETLDPLIGNWKIDLRPTPESDGYYQSFNVKTINKNIFTGTFYGSEIKNALINKNWDKIYFAFSTSDQSNEYYHSGFLENDKLFGITYCPNRKFTAPWTGIKQ
jgi:hypothetical protein